MKAGQRRGGVKDKVRSVVPSAVLLPNTTLVRRDKFGRISFLLTDKEYDDLSAKAEAMLPDAVTIPVVYDDFNNARVIRGKPIKGSGITVSTENEDELPVLEDQGPMAMDATYRVRGAMKATRGLGTPPQPCVYFAISTIEQVTAPLLATPPEPPQSPQPPTLKAAAKPKKVVKPTAAKKPVAKPPKEEEESSAEEEED